jgi:hypothetical protein
VVDAYSRAPVESHALFGALEAEFGLKWQVDAANTSQKPYYYSKQRAAGQVGYAPVYDALQGVLEQTRQVMTEYASQQG